MHGAASHAQDGNAKGRTACRPTPDFPSLTQRGATLDQGGLTMWPREGQVLRNEWDNLADGVLLKVSEVAELQEPIMVLLRVAFGSDLNRRAPGLMQRTMPLSSSRK